MLKNKIISAYLTSILGVFSGLLTNFWLLKELTIQINPAEFGLYSYIYQISSYLLILQLGMDFSVSRQIAEYLGKAEIDHAKQAYHALKRFNRYGIFVVVLAVIIAASLFYNGYGVEAVHKGIAVKLILLTGLNQVLVFFQRPFSAALIGSHQQETVNIVTVIRTVLTTLIALVLLHGGLGVLSTPVAEIATQLAANVFLMQYVKRKLPWGTANSDRIDKTIFSKLFHFAFFSTVGGLAWTVEATSDVLLIRHIVKDLGLLSVFVVWWRFPQMLYDLATRLGSSAFPVFAAQYGANDGSAQQTLNRVLLLVTFFASLSFIGISLWLPTFIHLWFPVSYHLYNPYVVSCLMGLIVAVRIIGNLFGYFLLALSNTKLTTRLAWTQALLKVGLAYCALNIWSLPGLLTASSIAALLQPLVYGLYLIRKELLDKQYVWFVGFLMVLSALLIYILPEVPTGMGLFRLLFWILLTVVFWIICFLALTLINKSYRPILLEFWKKWKDKTYAFKT